LKHNSLKANATIVLKTYSQQRITWCILDYVPLLHSAAVTICLGQLVEADEFTGKDANRNN
jgi:hypothetical protein